MDLLTFWKGEEKRCARLLPKKTFFLTGNVFWEGVYPGREGEGNL